MKYPNRHNNHLIEKRSLQILNAKLPSEWIIREVTERDYGIDLYVEIVGASGNVTGDMVALQVKGKERINVNDSGSFTFYQINESTLNYWKGLPIPVYFFVVCLTTEDCYWSNIREDFRSDKFQLGTDDTYRLSISNKNIISDESQSLFILNYLREKRWGAIEIAIEKSLMFFNSFGPFVLMCKRKSDEEYCTTVIQYTLLEHYEYYSVLSRYIIGKTPKPLPYWYDKNMEYLEDSKMLTFRYSIIKEMLNDFVDDYREAIRFVNLMVLKTHSNYFSSRFPYLHMHLKKRPLTFVQTDWYARYYHDEYENETQNIERKYFEDFSNYDDYDLLNELNT